MVALHPVKWSPPKAPAFEGPYAVNRKIADVALWPAPGVGPEDIAVDEEGFVYAGLEDGRLLRFAPEGGEPEVIGDTRGRPLGVEIDPEGRVVICDAYKGLLRLDPDGSLATLVDSFEGEKFLLTNNASIAGEGTIYFSVSSTRFDLAHYKLDLIEHSGTGRLFSLSPDGDLRKLLDGLYFANGVALSSDESFVAVNETGAYRTTRLWLNGDQAGERDVLIDNLPGFPDNLSHEDGIFWIPLASPRDALVDMLARHPMMAKLVGALPDRFQPAPSRHAIVLGVDAKGEVVYNLQDPDGAYAVITGVRQHDGRLYFGSLVEPGIGVLEL